MRRILLMTLLSLASACPHAQTIGLPVPASGASHQPSLPTRGMTMQAVRAKFGEPAQRQAAVGSPPITRWDYGDFIVVFEHRYVIGAIMPGIYIP